MLTGVGQGRRLVGRPLGAAASRRRSGRLLALPSLARPTKAVHCALELVPALATGNINIRAGVHTGECERRGDD
jgi:class 3 adenylate cyclase